ncbi:MAG: iron-sulfur cluster assembly scaffold protein [Patescibacteria group bacterium]
MNIDAFRRLQEYAEHSPHRGKIKTPDIRAHGENALCGDTLTLTCLLINGKVTDVKFEHTGCALSAAAAARFSAQARGKTYEQLKKLSPDIFLRSLGIPVSPARIPCALLPLAVAQSGVPIRKAVKRKRA